MQINSIAALNAFHKSFYREACARAALGEPYVAPQPQRTTDAAAQPVAEAACIGTFRHAGGVVVRIHEKGTQRG